MSYVSVFYFTVNVNFINRLLTFIHCWQYLRVRWYSLDIWSRSRCPGPACIAHRVGHHSRYSYIWWSLRSHTSTFYKGRNDSGQRPLHPKLNYLANPCIHLEPQLWVFLRENYVLIYVHVCTIRRYNKCFTTPLLRFF